MAVPPGWMQMKRVACVVALMLGSGALFAPAPSDRVEAQNAAPKHLGFDRNIYPGDEALPVLRATFDFAGYWLSAPPGEKASTWSGKRSLLASQGFGFAPLYLGPDSARLRNNDEAKRTAREDAQKAADAAENEGFESNAVIYLDIEEGGRLPEAYHAYIQEWSEELWRAGYRAGVYCSAIPVSEGKGVSITTAQDIAAHVGAGNVVFWVYNDACPPSPGCVDATAGPAGSGFAGAEIWQYSQSPRRKEYTAKCKARYAADGNCYAPVDTKHKWFLDMNVARTGDPSGN